MAGARDGVAFFLPGLFDDDDDELTRGVSGFDIIRGEVPAAAAAVAAAGGAGTYVPRGGDSSPGFTRPPSLPMSPVRGFPTPIGTLPVRLTAAELAAALGVVDAVDLHLGHIVPTLRAAMEGLRGRPDTDRAAVELSDASVRLLATRLRAAAAAADPIIRPGATLAAFLDGFATGAAASRDAAGAAVSRFAGASVWGAPRAGLWMA